MASQSDSSQTNIPDGRSLRKTERRETFSTKLLPGSKAKLLRISRLTNKNYNQIIEECLDLYLAEIERRLDELS